MLKREISEKLKLWRTQKNKKALCIIGARQIGKTTIIREFAKQEYEKGDKRGLDFLLNGDPYDKKLDYEKALRINREAYSLCQMILSCFNDIRRHLCFYYSLDGCDLRFLDNRYNTYFEKTIKQQEKSEQEFKFLLKRKDEED